MLKDKVFKTGLVLTLWLILFFRLTPVPASVLLLACSAVFLFCCAYFIVHASVQLHARLRNKWLNHSMAARLGKAILATITFSLTAVAGTCSLWQLIFTDAAASLPQFFAVMGSTSVLFIPGVLVYEILFLTKERELDDKVVKQLNSELTEAELNFLKNELDPHFVYNSLMPLYYLIKTNSDKAEQFTYKLMQVYQHFLQNRKRDLIPFEEELSFIENYSFLLRIRFHNSISIKLETPVPEHRYLIVPLTLQLLVENAIKHTRFDANTPLEIRIGFHEGHLTVSNRICRPMTAMSTSRVGLNNLRLRYQYLLNQTIYVFTEDDHFYVKVPLQEKMNEHDVRRYHRG